jgi:nicotinamide mononucleotide adenylyltransferase
MPADTQVHVVPVDDLRAHVEAPGCWCAPTQDAEEPRLWVHHAADMREHFEPGGPATVERPRA